MQAGEPGHMKTATELNTITTIPLLVRSAFIAYFMLHAKCVSIVRR